MDPLIWRGEGALMTEGPTVPEVDVDGLQKMLAEGARLLDVREPDEVDEVRVPGGLRIPLQSLPERLDEISSPGSLYVICAVGGRSQAAARHVRVSPSLLHSSVVDHAAKAADARGRTAAQRRVGRFHLLTVRHALSSALARRHSEAEA